ATSRPGPPALSTAASRSSPSSSKASSACPSRPSGSAEAELGGVTTLFISDLHLGGRDARTVGLFLDLLGGEARRARALYILGDLFEAWIGDDDDDPALRPIVAALRALTETGVDCAIMHGNRDFLLGERFAAATGTRLLGDFERVEVAGEHVLLTHGDLLCTDETRYLRLR